VVAVQPLVRMRELWTVEDLRELGAEDWRRYEIVDGSLVVSPSPAADHELVSEEVRAAIRAALPPGVKVVGPMGVTVGRSFRIPDLVVVSRDRLRRGVDTLDPADVLLAVEVVSPGSVTTDRVTKPAQYAAAGIPAFWRVETDPISLSSYLLRPGQSAYTELGTWGRGQTAHIGEPFAIDIDIDRLAE
jgi:Uma2 family endonuclease